MNKEIQWHNITFEEAIKKLNSDFERGLTEEEVEIRQRQFGKHLLPEEKPLPKTKIFFRQFKSPLIYILIIAGFVTLILRDFTDAIVIFGVVFLNTIIGFFQENKTSNILAALKKVVKVDAFVIRQGNEKEIRQGELVPGDIVLLNPGNKVPADGRLIWSHNLKINEAALTGEWLANKKDPKILKQETSLADRDNMVYMGTVVEEGIGRVIVTETGLQTEIGKVVEMVKEAKEEKTPFQKKVARFSVVLGLIIVFLCLFIFIFGVLTGKGYLEMLLTGIAVAVAAIPEGLPVAVTVTFAFGLQRILKKKGLVRKIVAAETLGSTSVIATDKTGTLTEGKMEVAGVYTPHQIFGGGQANEENGSHPAQIASQFNGVNILALKIATLCCEAFIENPDEALERWIVRGRPTDKALLIAGMQAGLNKKEIEKNQPRLDTVPFDPVYKYSAALHKGRDGKNILSVLGAPEVVLGMSKYLQLNGQQIPLLAEKTIELIKKQEILSSKGQRVLAVAYKETEQQNIDDQNPKIEELIFVGFITLHDPLRKDAKNTIKTCQRAGMRVILVTGDHKLTAKAIAQELGLPCKEKNILEGKQLDKMSDEELKKVVKDIEIYARVEPRHKMRIIQAWQDVGEVVAMTGDGVNDAPALKKADIGVALGSGTEAAKEVSDLILLSDNLSIIITAVKEGRRIMDNVRKIITYLLSGGFTEIMLIGFSVIFRLPLPVLPGQILWKNMIESTLPAMALTFESEEKDIMNRSPEDPRLPLLNKEMNVLIFIIGIFSNIILFGLFLWFFYMGYPIELIRSIIFVGLAIDSFFVIFSCRNLRKNIWQYNPFSNTYVNLSIASGFFFLIIALYVPVFQKLLKTVSLGFFEWLILLAFGLLNFALVEIAKWVFIKYKKTN